MWGGDSKQQQTLKSRGAGGGAPGGMMGDEESDYFPPTPRKDWSTGLLKLVTAMVIFMGGVVLGLSVSGSVARYYYNASHAELFFPSTTYGCDPRDRDCGLGLAFKAFVLADTMTGTSSAETLSRRATPQWRNLDPCGQSSSTAWAP